MPKCRRCGDRTHNEGPLQALLDENLVVEAQRGLERDHAGPEESDGADDAQDILAVEAAASAPSVAKMADLCFRYLMRWWYDCA